MNEGKPAGNPLPAEQLRMERRFPARGRTLPGLLWSARTLLEKKRIAWEDRRGSFSYDRWIRSVEVADLRSLVQAAAALPADRKVEFVISGELTPTGLETTLRSLRALRSPWLATLFMELRSELASAPWLVDLLASEPHLQLIPKESAAEVFSLPRLAQESGADWLVPLRCGDRLSAQWERGFLLYAHRHPAAGIFFWDEDEMGEGGREKPFFKPGWSPELLFAVNFLESAAFRRDLLLQAAETWDAASESWIFSLAQMGTQVVHIPHILQHRGPLSAQAAEDLRQAHEAAVKAALDRMGCAYPRVSRTPQGDLRAAWKPAPALVSIVIPTRNHPEHIRRCIHTLVEKTRGVDYEVIVMDDHSADPDTLAFYKEVQSRQPQVRVYPNEGPFNYSRVNNQGARLARGELILFLNNDVEILHSGWLSELVRWAQMPGVGMVGAKLLYPSASIQHAGIVLGMTGHAGHLYAGKNAPRETLFLSPEVYRNVSAVTGACMLVRRDAFEQAGGFDENLMLVFNDVDLGARFLQKGWRIVYTPASELVHYEGVSRSRYMPPGDIRLGAERLSEVITAGDAYYSPNLSLSVNWPTFRRPGEPSAAERLRRIVQWKG